ncbi:MAG: hypothetical protein JXR13_07725 [Thalassovita sp.]
MKNPIETVFGHHLPRARPTFAAAVILFVILATPVSLILVILEWIWM